MSQTLLLVLAAVIAAGIVVIIVLLLHPKPAQTNPAAEQRLAEINANLQTMGQMLAHAQSQLQQTVNQRLDAVTQNLGESMKTTTKNTTEHLQQLHARLAVIDSAQKNITELATQVSSLQGILANKQSRGAFGQGQLEAIIADVLPKGAYEFQHMLSNRTRPDCAIFMPDSGPLIIDAKFPLEAMTAWRDAETEDERKQAVARVKQDITKHVADIAGKYLIPGETQDIALMFIPSESVYADLHERFDDIVQRAQRARVMIVSPTLMVMAIQVIKQVRKDAEILKAKGVAKYPMALALQPWEVEFWLTGAHYPVVNNDNAASPTALVIPAMATLILAGMSSELTAPGEYAACAAAVQRRPIAIDHRP